MNTPPKWHCQNGRPDVCLMATYDGVLCPDECCDIDEGDRAPPVKSHDDGGKT